MLVYTCNFIDRSVIATLGQAIKLDLRISDAQLGLLQGLAFARFYVAMGIPLARIAERANRVSLISVCLVLWSGMTALCGTASSYAQLFLYRMGVGIGEAGCSPPAHSLITDLYSPRSRATALSIYSLGIPFGVMFGAIFGGWLADNLGWRWAFAVVGLPGIALAIVFKLAVREPARGLVDRAGHADATQPPPLMAVVRALFGKPAFVHVLIGATLIGFVGYGTGTFAQPYFNRAFGLSYTQFKISNVQLNATQIRPDGTIRVTAEVQNAGKRAGDEVVQLYIRDVAASIARPVKELKGFKRITLQPGEKRSVDFVLGPEHLGFYNREMKFVVEPGEFRVMVGSNSQDVIEKTFEVR